MALLDRQLTADTLAASAVRRLLAAINSPIDDLEMQVGVRGHPFAIRLADDKVSLAIEGEAGKIDVLTGNPEILSRYADQSGLLPMERDALMAALLEARAVRNGPAALDALYFYLTPAGRDVEQDFTMRSGLVGVDPTFASARVLRSIPDLTASAVANILSLRESDPAAVASESRYFAAGRPSFSIVATVTWGANERLIKRVPIEITTGGRAMVLSGFR